MAWTTPKSWTTEPLTSVDLNTHLRDNLNALKTPPSGLSSVYGGGTGLSTSSSSFADMGGIFTQTLTVTGGDLLVGFSGMLAVSAASAYLSMTILSDGSNQLSGDGLSWLLVNTIYPYVSWQWYLTGIAAGARTIKLQWKISTGNAYVLYGSGNSAGQQANAQFFVKEMG